MIKFIFNKIKVKVYTDPMEFANMPEKPFGEIPNGAKFVGIEGDFKSSGFTCLSDKVVRIYVDKKCPFEELLSTVSHELGHLIEGGFKKNPPDKNRYFNKHEEKAEHYENFTLNAYKLTCLIFKKIK